LSGGARASHKLPRAVIFKPSLERSQADAAARAEPRKTRAPKAQRAATEEVHHLFAQDPKRRLQLVTAVWSRAVGPDLMRRTRPETLEAGVLRVRVPDTRWRQVLHRMQPHLLAQLRAVLGDLAPRRLSFVEGGMDALPVTPPPSAPITGTTPLPESVAMAAAAIADPEVRVAFERSAARYLALSVPLSRFEERPAALPAPSAGPRSRRVS